MRRIALILVLIVAGLGGVAVWRGWLGTGQAAALPKAGTTRPAIPPTRSGKSSRAPSAEPAAALRPIYTDVAAEAGIDFTYFNDAVPDRFWLPETLGGGAAWCDYDGDGWLDLYLPDGTVLDAAAPPGPPHGNRLYRNLGRGRFVDVTAESHARVSGYGHGCAAGDYDADGFVDFYLTNFGINLLLRNNGDGTFEEVTAAAGVGDPQWGASAAWFDAELDGDLDLYVSNYVDWSIESNKKCITDGLRVYCGPRQFNGLPDVFYVNRGDGTFADGTEEFGFAGPAGKGMGVLVADLDHDLLAEVYVTNDVEANFLFTQTRPPEATVEGPQRLYAELAVARGCGLSDQGEAEASMGVACGDFDGNGWPDLFLTHFYEQKSTLYSNLSELMFEDASKRTRVAAHTFLTLGFGTVALDYDRDGAEDLFMANGNVLGRYYEPWKMHAQLLRNDGQGRFDDVSKQAGDYFARLLLGRGVAGGDFDNDGDLDLAISHQEAPVSLLRDDTVSTGHFLGLELQTLNRVPPIGGRVVVTTKEKKQTRPVIGAGSYLSTSDPRLLFGLGEVSEPVSVEVFWPSGTVDHYELAPDRYWLLTEGKVQPPHTGDAPRE